MARCLGAGGKTPATRATGARAADKAREKAAKIVEEAEGAGEDAEARARMRKAPRPHLCRPAARKWFAEELPAIFDTFAEGAKKGDVVCLKALLTLSGFDKEETHAPPARQRRGRSLAKILLDDLRRNPPVPKTPAGNLPREASVSSAVRNGS